MNDEQQRILDTLFHPFESGTLSAPGKGARVAFVNARPHPALRLFGACELFLRQYFRPYARRLEAAGYAIGDGNFEPAELDMALLALPKSRIETEYMIAAALRALKTGGVLVAAADNKAGGGRLEKTMATFGLRDVQADSRNKCRVVAGRRGNGGEEVIETAIATGSPQKILNGEFHSWPGIFGWDKIDRGSEILLRCLSADLKGRGADFGCGYGYLAHYIVQQKSVTELLCVDADIRALRMCERNIKHLAGGVGLSFLWEDLRHSVAACRDLDFILMNPPFHEGKASSEDIGAAFIATAAASLKPNGMLYMVANRQLAYERTLENLFAKCGKVFEGEGFKVFQAIR